MKRKKQNRLLLILVIALVLIALCYTLLFRHNKEVEKAESESESEETITLYNSDFDTSNISSFSFTTSDNKTLKFVKDGDNWTYSEDKNFPVNASLISDITSTLLNMTGKRQVESSLDKNSDYGLDKPTRTVTVTDNSKHEMTIYFGNSNDITGDYYIYTNETDKVYTTESSNYEAFNYSLMDLVAIDSVPSMDATLLNNVTVDKADGKWTMTYKEAGDSSLDYTGELTWFVTNPDKSKEGMDSSTASTFTTNVTGITTDTCVAYNVAKKDLKKYGLDNPKATVTVNYQEEVESDSSTETESATSDSTEETTSAAKTYENKTFTFHIGNKKDDDSYYFTFDGSNQVCLLSAETAEYFLNINNKTFLLTNPLNIPVASVDKLQIDSTTFTITHKDDKTTYSKDGKDYDSTTFTNLYDTIKGIASEKTYVESDTEKDTKGKTLTLTYSLNDNKTYSTITFKFAPYDKDYYSLSINGTKKWLVNKIDVTNLQSMLEK